MSTDRPMTRDELVAELVALRAELAQVKKERDHAVAATRELLATNIRSCALSRTTRGIDGMIRDELLRLAERVKTNAWEQ